MKPYILAEAQRCTVSSTGTYAYGVGSSGYDNVRSETAYVEVGTNPRLGMS